MGVAYILQVKVYDLNGDEKVPIIKNWLGREGLQFIHSHKCCKGNMESSTGLFNVLKEKFRPQHNEMILSLKYCKLHRKKNESAQQWMGQICIEVAEYNYKEHVRRLKEPFINGLDDNEITQEIIKELTTQRNAQDIESEQVPMCAQRVESQRAQKSFQ